jgi:hypothetical protein
MSGQIRSTVVHTRAISTRSTTTTDAGLAVPLHIVRRIKASSVEAKIDFYQGPTLRNPTLQLPLRAPLHL